MKHLIPTLALGTLLAGLSSTQHTDSKNSRERAPHVPPLASGSPITTAPIGLPTRGGAQPIQALPVCTASIRDQANPSQCIQATSVPTPGLLFPPPHDGGVNNVSSGTNSFIGGGQNNQATNGSGGGHTTIAGGQGNTATGNWATVSGGFYNSASGDMATVGGGGGGNTASGNTSAIGGGSYNTASGTRAMIGGGLQNQASATHATVAGGRSNIASEYCAAVGGGYHNTASNLFSTVGGGRNNRAMGNSSSIGGGRYNTVWEHYVAVGGGFGNVALSRYATIGGGTYNTAGYAATVSGGWGNNALNNFAMVPGGLSNLATGPYSFAAGRQAKATHAGSFVWGDSQDTANKTSSAVDEFNVYADGGARIFASGTSSPSLVIDSAGNVGIGTASPGFLLEVNGDAAKPGGGAWSQASDVRLKKNIRDLEGALETLLALRGVSFEYQNPKAIHELPGTRIGFIAQEVEKVLPDWVEEGKDGYKRLTVRGFEALTVEALRQVHTENQCLREANSALEARIARLESLEAEIASLKASLQVPSDSR